MLSPMEALVFHPGEGGRKREEERKEAASFLGLGTCWTDGLESASGEAEDSKSELFGGSQCHHGKAPKISVSPGMEKAKIWHMKGLLQI